MELSKKDNLINQEKSPKKKISPFLHKLYNILEVSKINITIKTIDIQDEKNNSIIKWNKEGNGFIIVDYKRFITELLSKNFKTEVFSSFIRQLNLYDFHKIKSKESNNTTNNNQNNNNSIYEFTNVNFLKNDPEKINLIKRKTKTENMPNKIQNMPFKEIKGNELVVHTPRRFLNFKNDTKTKLNLNKMYKKAIKLSEIVNTLRRKVEVLEGKYDFLEYCNYEFGRNNKDIINKLQKILDKKKNLENFFFYMIRNFFPNIKLVENPIHNSSSPSTSIQSNNQINDLKNNEIISQIYKIFNLSDSNLSTNNISSNNNFVNNSNKINNFGKSNIINNKNCNEDNLNGSKAKIEQLMDQLIDKEQFNVEAREINTYNKILDFQKKYFTDLDDQNTSALKSVSYANKDSQDNNSLNLTDNDNIKSDKDILNVTSNNNSIDNKSNQFLNKKKGRDTDNTISDGSKDLL